MLPQLCLHRGGQAVQFSDLQTVPTPQRTASWVPIPHAVLAEQVIATLNDAGLTVVGAQHALSKDGARYFGLLQVKTDTDAPDFAAMIGVRNSHDQSYPAGLALGSRVLVCDNLAFSAEVVLNRKHTAQIARDLPGLVYRAVAKLAEGRGEQDRRIEAYKRTTLDTRDAHDLLVRAVDARALPARWLMDALAEWRTPRHAEFEAGGKTGWRLFNAVTEALKGSSDLHALPGRTSRLHGLMDAACGVFTRVVDGEVRQVRRVEPIAIAA